VLEGSLTQSAEWAADVTDDDDDDDDDDVVPIGDGDNCTSSDNDDNDGDDDGNETANTADHAADADDSSVALTWDEWQRDVLERRRKLQALGLGPLPAAPLPADSESRVMAAVLPKAVLLAQAKQAASTSDFVLQAPIVADESVKWAPLTLGGALRDRRIGAAAATIGRIASGAPSSGVLFGGSTTDGALRGDGAILVSEGDSVRVSSLPMAQGLTTREQRKGRQSPAPGALLGCTASYCAGSDTLVVIGGIRNGQRQRSVSLLRLSQPPGTPVAWGAMHAANVDMSDRFFDKGPQAVPVWRKNRHNTNVLTFCRCDLAYSQNRGHNQSFKEDVERILQPHHALPITPKDLPALAFHSSVGLAAVVITFGGKFGTSNELFPDVLIVNSQPLMQFSKVKSGYLYSSAHYRLSEAVISFQRVPVDAAVGYQPTTGAAAVGLGAVAYVIGGMNKNSEPINDSYSFDMRTQELARFEPSSGRLPPIANHAAAVVKSTVVIFGGVGAKRTMLNNVFVVDLVTRSIAGLIIQSGISPSPRMRHSAMVVGDDIVFAGGTLAAESSGADAHVVLRGVAKMHTIASVHTFAALLDSDTQFADVVIRNGAVQTSAHRCILAARCPALLVADERSRTLASGRTVSCSRQGGKLTITVDEAPTEFSALLRFLYTDTVDLEQVNLDVLVRQARDFGLTVLERLCESVTDSGVVVPSSTFMADMRGLLDDSATADVVFCVQGDGDDEPQRFHAHRALLGPQCEYFRLMLGGAFREASATEIVIGDIEPDVFFAGLRFLYTGVVDNADAQQLFELLYVSSMWSLPELKAICEAFLLARFVTVDTCLLLLEAAMHNSCSVEFRTAVFAACRNHFGAASGMTLADDNWEAFLEALRSRLDDADADLNGDPVQDGYVPRGGLARRNGLPLLYDPATWPKSLGLPTTMLSQAAVKRGLTFAFVPVSDPDLVGFRTDVEIDTLPRVKVLGAFSSAKLARQNAALFALHQLKASST
jgi:hypothetical protein